MKSWSLGAPERPTPSGFPAGLIGGIMGYTKAPEHHRWRDARVRHSRAADLLQRLSLQPLDRHRRGSMAGWCKAVWSWAALRLSGLW